MELRSELKHLIDTTDDLSILEWVKSVLAPTPLSKEMAEDMLRVARLSDEDIAAGRTYTVDEVKRWMDEQKGKA